MVDAQNRRFSDQYWKFLNNSPKLLNEIKKGVFKIEKNPRRTPEEDILNQLKEGSWESIYKKGFPKFTFLGMRVTTDCNLSHRCIYCDQKVVENKLGMDDWKNIIDEVTENGNRRGIYIGISGGEPLLLGDFLYGDEGLIKYASDRGGVVNVNTNFHLLTPQIATSLIKSGTAKLHVSLDSPNEKIHDILEYKGTFRRVWESIYSMQMAKKITGSKYPVLHINTVATKKNLKQFDNLLSALLVKRRLAEDYSEGNTHTNPDLRDLAPHLILIGGKENAKLRPTEEDWDYFVNSTWPNASRIWDNFQIKHKVPRNKRTDLSQLCFFANPFTRVKHNQNIKEVIKNFVRGDYANTSLSEECYTAPTQAYVLANGDVYQCGSLSDSESKPIGNILETNSVKEIVKSDFNNPLGKKNPHCVSCYGCTLNINQQVEKILLNK